MSEPTLTFKDWLKKHKEQVKVIEIRLDTLRKASHHPVDQALTSGLLVVYDELSSLYDALERLYENEIEPYKPMLEHLNRWIEEKRKEDEARERYR